MLFYRVENKKGEGPYRNTTALSLSAYLETRLDYSMYLLTHPTPQNDALAKFIKQFPSYAFEQYIFGFSSIDQLKNWFNTGFDEQYMEKYNFHISIYEIRKSKFNVAVSEFQTTALKRKLKLVNTIPFTLKDL